MTTSIPIAPLLSLAKALIDHIPTPDPALRMKRLEARLERQKMRLEAKLQEHSHEYKGVDQTPWSRV